MIFLRTFTYSKTNTKTHTIFTSFRVKNGNAKNGLFERIYKL